MLSHKKSRVRIAADPDFRTVLHDSGRAPLDSLAYEPGLALAPRTRYFWRVDALADNGETASADSWFETGKMGEAWSARWITCDFAEPRHPVFLKEIAPEQLEGVVSARLYICGLGLYDARIDGAPISDERMARELVEERKEQKKNATLGTAKKVTLEDLFAQIKQGEMKELPIIVKADVDGSVEALSDSLIKLSTENIQVNVIHQAVGAISESDVMLAAASNAIIIGFNVRPTGSARKMADSEEVDIRIYNVIYDALEELKAAMTGMLAPEIKEEVTATLEVLQTFHISKVGTIAGCVVREGKAKRTNKCRVIRDGIVIHTGELSSLKHGKDDIKEVGLNQECGLSIKAFNDVVEHDIIETYEEIEIAKTL